MDNTSSSVLNEAYQRLHWAGPEWDGDNRLANHGPMAVEVLVRRGRDASVTPWLDNYVKRLDDLPSAAEPISDSNWQSAMGKTGRVGDWMQFFTHKIQDTPWRELLATWWPRLLPGAAAGATHGVIRVSHAVRALLATDGNPAAVTELAHGLAYWAARSQAVPGAAVPSGSLTPQAALAALPRIADQRGTVADRFGQLAELAEWSPSITALRAPSDADEARQQLTELVEAATLRYLTHAHRSPVLLVHTATAPNGVLHTLPALPRDLWVPSFGAIWATCAAITSAYAPGLPAERAGLPTAPTAADPIAELLDRATAHGNEHVIKFTDTAADVYTRSGNPDALAAAVHAAELIHRP